MTSLQLPRSAGRSLALLDHVVSAGRCTLTEAAEAADLPVSTALRHLLAMQQARFLDRDEAGVFSAGPAFLRLALKVVSTGPQAGLAELAEPHLRRLTEATEESTYLAIRDGSRAIYIACVEGTRSIRHVGWVGHTVPIEGSAVGAAMTTLDRASAPAVRTGAVEPDITAVAVPIFSGGPTPVAAICAIGPADRLVGERLHTALSQAAAAREGLEIALTNQSGAPASFADGLEAS